jgi:uncharacterized protein involved in exopolysaccharide biosynthesis
VNDVTEATILGSKHEVDVVALWWAIWDQKYLVLALTAVCALIALVLAFTMTPVFRATIVVTPTQDRASLGGNSNLSGLASLAGLSLGMNAEELERAAVLQSRRLIEAFVGEPAVFTVLVAQARKAGIQDPDSTWKTTERFRKTVLDIQPDKLKGTTTITVDWTDPAVAARWANEFVALANQLVRDKAIADSTRNIEFLHKEIDKTTSVEIQRVLYNLVEEETKTLMLASGRVEYAFTVVDPAVTPQIRVRPWRSLILASGIAAGLFLGCFVVYCRERFARPKSRH